MTDSQSIFMDAREIAGRLEISAATFRKNARRLMERDGFPLPAPHCLKPMKWRREAFEAWFATLGQTADDLRATPPGQPPATNVHLLKHARTA